MKKYLTFIIVGLLLSVNLPAQNILNAFDRVLNGLMQQSQQRNNQRNNNQRTYPNNQRHNRQNGTDQQRRETQQRYNNQQQGNNADREESSDKNSSFKKNQVQGDDKMVTLVTSGTGATKEEAIQNALRSAIEQAFGTFVSANTEVLNDELIKDEITTVSTGNIRAYNELSVNQINSIYDVSVQAIVSIDQLTKYAQSKGMKAELAGASFVMNMKMRELNRKNEITAIEHMVEKAKAIGKNGLFDYKLEISEPILTDSSNYAVKTIVLFYENSNTRAFYDLIYNTLEALSLNNTEVEEYEKVNMKYYGYDRQLNEGGGLYILRNSYDRGGDYSGTCPWIMPILIDAALNYEIKDNIGTVITCRSLKIDSITRSREAKQMEKTNQLTWYYEEEDKDSKGYLQRDGYYYYFYPSNRIAEITRSNYRIEGLVHRVKLNVPIYDYGDDRLHRLHFNPLLEDNVISGLIDRSSLNRGLMDRRNKRLYYQQDFFIIYSENELSKLNSITIEHRK